VKGSVDDEMKEDDRETQRILAKLSGSLAVGSITMSVPYALLRMSQHQNLAQQSQASLFRIYNDSSQGD